MTKPTDPSTLEAFYTLVRPAGPGWRPIAALHPDIQPDATIASMARQWGAGVVLVYACLFSVGYLILGNTLAGILMLLVAIASTLYLRWTFDQKKAH